MFCSRPAVYVVRPFRVTRYISTLSGWISMKLGTHIHYINGQALLKRFSRSGVKSQGHYVYKCVNATFRRVALRLNSVS